MHSWTMWETSIKFRGLKSFFHILSFITKCFQPFSLCSLGLLSSNLLTCVGTTYAKLRISHFIEAVITTIQRREGPHNKMGSMTDYCLVTIAIKGPLLCSLLGTEWLLEKMWYGNNKKSKNKRMGFLNVKFYFYDEHVCQYVARNSV